MSQIRIDRTARRIRAQLAGVNIGDSTNAKLSYAQGRHPEYMFPVDDVAWDCVTVGDADPQRDVFGLYSEILAGDANALVGRRYDDGPGEGLVHLDFEAMDTWFEEEEQIWFHVRDPFRRVDVTESSRHVEITVNGTTVAVTDRPRLITETALPERWYIPRADVDWSKLTASDTTSACQYKGVADWWHVDVGDDETLADVAWGYERPVTEATKLAGLIAFYGEHAAVETIVDGVTQQKPRFDPSWLNPSLHISNSVAEPEAVARASQVGTGV